MSDERYDLALGDLRFQVDPRAGGRVTSFRFGAAEALTSIDTDPKNYGSTLWTSPQSDWGWPPPAEFDEAPYAVVREDDAITVTGPPSAFGVRLTKRFSADRKRGAIVLEYSVQNVGRVPLTCAPWEVSRVPARGLSFYETGASSGGPLRVERTGKATWYAHDPDVLSDVGEKAYGDAARGYLAHVLYGQLLFVKGFDDLPPERQAPGEGEVEIYGNNRYVELEVQGPYAPIAPGAWSAPWVVRWYLRKIPTSIAPTLGNAGLLEFAATVAL